MKITYELDLNDVDDSLLNDVLLAFKRTDGTQKTKIIQYFIKMKLFRD